MNHKLDDPTIDKLSEHLDRPGAFVIFARIDPNAGRDRIVGGDIARDNLAQSIKESVGKAKETMAHYCMAPESSLSFQFWHCRDVEGGMEILAKFPVGSIAP